MNAALLLEHYARIADAPDAIARLRRFVLDLAVRGKLVEQDAGDEPASELLERIATEKARLVKVGTVRDRAALPAVMPQDAPYSLPSSWMWVRFANIVEFYAGRTPARNDLSYWNTGDHAWVSIADMEDGGTIQQTKETVSDIARTNVFKSEPEPAGTMVMSFKLTIGKIARLGVPAFHNEAIISIHPHLEPLDGYLFMSLPELARAGDTKGAIKGATLNRDSLSNILVPLPPLAEQHRIVAKVDELMALCDQLEAARAEREAARDTFTLSTLAKLNTPDPETFGQDARFALANLVPLTIRTDQIKQQRQTILNLAMRGKLVEQDAADEPALELLKRTADDIEAYCSANRVARAKPERVAEGAVPFSAPAGWTWVRLCQLFRVITDGDHQPPPRADQGIAFLTIGNVTTGQLDFNGCRLVPESYFRALPAYRTPLKGDILYTVVGATFGRPALVESEREFCVQRHIAILKPAKTMEIRFLLLLLASPLVD
jgi:type I restriction enzyme S subunit